METFANGADLGQLLTALAAVTAAVLAAVNLYLSGRREEVRWRRDSLVDAFEKYAQLSFASTSGARRALRARAAPSGRGDWQRLLEEDEAFHVEHNAALTRLRLLADAHVVRAAEALHLQDHGLTDIAFGSDIPPDEESKARFDMARRANRQAKQDFFNAARASVGLDRAADISEDLWSQ